MSEILLYQESKNKHGGERKATSWQHVDAASEGCGGGSLGAVCAEVVILYDRLGNIIYSPSWQ